MVLSFQVVRYCCIALDSRVPPHGWYEGALFLHAGKFSQHTVEKVIDLLRLESSVPLSVTLVGCR